MSTVLKKKLDKVFSEYIRQRDNGVCFTCGNRKEWKEQDCGHYVTRGCLALRFDEINCNCQCKRCNIFLKGNIAEYALRLTRKHGPLILEELDSKKHQITKLGKSWYEIKIDEYKEKTKSLQKRELNPLDSSSL